MQAELGGNEAMTCQELLALSGALSAALPTGQLALDSFLNSLTKGKSMWRTTDTICRKIEVHELLYLLLYGFLSKNVLNNL